MEIDLGSIAIQAVQCCIDDIKNKCAPTTCASVSCTWSWTPDTDTTLGSWHRRVYCPNCCKCTQTEEPDTPSNPEESQELYYPCTYDCECAKCSYVWIPPTTTKCTNTGPCQLYWDATVRQYILGYRDDGSSTFDPCNSQCPCSLWGTIPANPEISRLVAGECKPITTEGGWKLNSNCTYPCQCDLAKPTAPPADPTKSEKIYGACRDCVCIPCSCEYTWVPTNPVLPIPTIPAACTDNTCEYTFSGKTGPGICGLNNPAILTWAPPSATCNGVSKINIYSGVGEQFKNSCDGGGYSITYPSVYCTNGQLNVQINAQGSTSTTLIKTGPNTWASPLGSFFGTYTLNQVPNGGSWSQTKACPNNCQCGWQIESPISVTGNGENGTVATYHCLSPTSQCTDPAKPCVWKCTPPTDGVSPPNWILQSSGSCTKLCLPPSNLCQVTNENSYGCGVCSTPYTPAFSEEKIEKSKSLNTISTLSTCSSSNCVFSWTPGQVVPVPVGPTFCGVPIGTRPKLTMASPALVCTFETPLKVSANSLDGDYMYAPCLNYAIAQLNSYQITCVGGALSLYITQFATQPTKTGTYTWELISVGESGFVKYIYTLVPDGSGSGTSSTPGSWSLSSTCPFPCECSVLQPDVSPVDPTVPDSISYPCIDKTTPSTGNWIQTKSCGSSCVCPPAPDLPPAVPSIGSSKTYTCTQNPCGAKCEWKWNTSLDVWEATATCNANCACSIPFPPDSPDNPGISVVVSGSCVPTTTTTPKPAPLPCDVSYCSYAWDPVTKSWGADLLCPTETPCQCNGTIPTAQPADPSVPSGVLYPCKSIVTTTTPPPPSCTDPNAPCLWKCTPPTDGFSPPTWVYVSGTCPGGVCSQPSYLCQVGNENSYGCGDCIAIPTFCDTDCSFDCVNGAVVGKTCFNKAGCFCYNPNKPSDTPESLCAIFKNAIGVSMACAKKL